MLSYLIGVSLFYKYKNNIMYKVKVRKTMSAAESEHSNNLLNYFYSQVVRITQKGVERPTMTTVMVGFLMERTIKGIYCIYCFFSDIHHVIDEHYLM